jgi:hypothetical protein
MTPAWKKAEREQEKRRREVQEQIVMNHIEHSGTIERWLMSPEEIRAAERLRKRGKVAKGHAEHDGRLTIYSRA